jgi:hypothetical protein
VSEGMGEGVSHAEDRFDRQRLLPGFADAGLPRLRDARVHVVGAGPTAAAALLYLARSGVGTLYVDDGADVAPGDAGAWLYPPGLVGQPRMLAALEALRAASSTVEVRPAASDTSATAVLVCARGEGVARSAAARARLAGLPHVVALGDGDGGEVLAIPLGAPCFDCCSRPGARVEPRGGAAAALGTLAALELLLLLAGLAPAQERGRRVVLAGGQPKVEATVRRPGCGCRLY